MCLRTVIWGRPQVRPLAHNLVSDPFSKCVAEVRWVLFGRGSGPLTRRVEADDVVVALQVIAQSMAATLLDARLDSRRMREQKPRRLGGDSPEDTLVEVEVADALHLAQRIDLLESEGRDASRVVRWGWVLHGGRYAQHLGVVE